MTQSQRVLTILKYLSYGKKVCTKQLSLEFVESSRTMQRDMKVLKEFLGDSFVQIDRGCYQLLNGSFLSNILTEHRESKELKSFFEFLTLFDSKSLKFLQSQEFAFLNQIKKETNEIYAIFENPIEELNHTSFLDDLKLAIKDRRYCDIIYDEKAPRNLKNIQPQKILYAKNNWYLAAMTQNYKINGGFKRFRINFIKNLTLKSKTFHRDLQAQEHIKNFQSLFQDFLKKNYEVKLSVDAEVARFFKVKKYLSSQKIIEENDKGLIVTFEINNEMEIIPLIKTWIPHIKVISPKSLKDRLEKEIRMYLS